MRDQASRNYASEMARDGACRVIAGTLRSMSASGADVRDTSAKHPQRGRSDEVAGEKDRNKLVKSKTGFGIDALKIRSTDRLRESPCFS